MASRAGGFSSGADFDGDDGTGMGGGGMFGRRPVVTVTRLFQQSFNRTNLRYEVRRKENTNKSIVEIIR